MCYSRNLCKNCLNEEESENIFFATVLPYKTAYFIADCAAEELALKSENIQILNHMKKKVWFLKKYKL